LLRVREVGEIVLVFHVEGLDLLQDFERVVLNGAREGLLDNLLVHHRNDEVQVLDDLFLVLLHLLLLVLVANHHLIVLLLSSALLVLLLSLSSGGLLGSLPLLFLQLLFSLLPLLLKSALFVKGPLVLELVRVQVFNFQLDVGLLQLIDQLLHDIVSDVFSFLLQVSFHI